MALQNNTLYSNILKCLHDHCLVSKYQIWRIRMWMIKKYVEFLLPEFNIASCSVINNTGLVCFSHGHEDAKLHFMFLSFLFSQLTVKVLSICLLEMKSKPNFKWKKKIAKKSDSGFNILCICKLILKCF